LAHLQGYLQNSVKPLLKADQQPSRFIEDLLHDLPTFEKVVLPVNDTLISLVTATSASSPEDRLALTKEAHFGLFLNNLREELKKARECELSVWYESNSNGQRY
jgi:hypothetical protein